MENINTWADFAALQREELDALSPEEMETLKTSITENEAKLAEEKNEELKKAKEIAENQRIRAEKAEKGKKEEEKKEDKKETSELSTKDILYLAKADIHEDDLGDVLEWAKFKNISVNEAHKALKGALDVRAEERKTAAASNTRTSRPGTQVSGETLLEKAKRGEISEKDEDIDKLVEARMEEKLKK